MKIVSKIHQKSIKNQWKWGPWGRPGATLGVFGVMLVESDRFWPYFGSNLEGLGRILAPRGRVLGDFGLQVGAQNRPKSIPRAIWNVINFLMDLKIDFWSDLVPSWPPTPPKMKPSWLQNRCKLGCWFESCFVMDFGWIFIDFLPQHGMAEVAKIVNSSTFFINFWYFGSWAFGLILGLIFDRFLVDFGIENRWKIDQKTDQK